MSRSSAIRRAVPVVALCLAPLVAGCGADPAPTSTPMPTDPARSGAMEPGGASATSKAEPGKTTTEAPK